MSFIEDRKIKYSWMSFWTICLAGIVTSTAAGELKVLVDQVGYESNSLKKAIIVGTLQDHPEKFSLVDAASGKVVLTGRLVPNGQVDSWGGRVFWTADFSSLRTIGHYAIQIQLSAEEIRSCPFDIDDDLLERNTLSNVIFYFKGQRASGLIDQADRHLPLPAGQSGFVDAHGGWYDATGDYGIHLSHQILHLTLILSRHRWSPGVC